MRAASASRRRSASSAARRSLTSKMIPSSHSWPSRSTVRIPRSRTQAQPPDARATRYSRANGRSAATATPHSSCTRARSSGWMIELKLRPALPTNSAAGYPVIRSMSSPMPRIVQSASTSQR